MRGFTVKFKLQLISIPCFLSAKNSNSEILLDGIVADHKVRVLLSSKNSPGLTNAGSGEKRFFFNALEIEIYNDNEDLVNCEFIYGRARAVLMVYQDIVLEVLNNLISYFKYDLRNPRLRQISVIDLLPQAKDLYNPEWSTLDGKPIKISDGPIEPELFSAPGVGLLQDNLFGIIAYTDDKYAALLERTFAPVDRPLVEDLLSDAQASALSGNLRRAVLELAITIEVYVKNNFFKREKIAGSAFEYLEDKGKDTIKVIELLDGAAAYAFGESFKKLNPPAYKDIDHVFRCRNKIAHRGEARFRDDNGNWIQVDFDLLRKWWCSTLEMFAWLKLKSNLARAGD